MDQNVGGQSGSGELESDQGGTPHEASDLIDGKFNKDKWVSEKWMRGFLRDAKRADIHLEF